MGWITEKTRELELPELEQGSLLSDGTLPSDGSIRTDRVRTSDFIKLYAPVSCRIETDDDSLYCFVYRYYLDSETQFSNSGWQKVPYTFNTTSKIKIKVILSHTSSAGTPMSVSDAAGFKIIADYGNIQWGQDSSKMGSFPYVIYTNGTDVSQLADEYNGTNSPWIIDGNFFGYPYLRRAGIAGAYSDDGGDSGDSKLYMDSVKVVSLYYNGQQVKKCYMDNVLVFESS